MDLWYGFACHGIDLLCKNGNLCFIAQNNWTTSTGAKLLRKKVITDTRICQLIDFNTYMVFENASIQTMIMLFEKNKVLEKYNFDYRSIISDSKRIDLLDILDKKNSSNVKFLTPHIQRNELKDSLLTFTENDSIFDKISKNKIYFDEKEIAQGIVPNPDVVNSRNQKNLTNKNIKVGEGVFVIDKDLFGEKLPETEKKYLKPLYEPYQMRPFYLEENTDKRLIYITKENWKDDAPIILGHLEKYKEIMEQRRENQNGRLNFMHLHWPREEEFFSEGEKILSVRKCTDRPIFVYYTHEAYVMMSVNVIKTQRWNMKFLSGLLNSKLIAFWLKNKGKMQGNNYQVDKEPLLGIPLPPQNSIPTDIEQDVISTVEQIIPKMKGNSEDTGELESKINMAIYKLYQLTSDEIKIIEETKL